MAGPWEQYKSSSVTAEPAPSVGPWSDYTKANEDVQAAKAVSTFDYILYSYLVMIGHLQI